MRTFCFAIMCVLVFGSFAQAASKSDVNRMVQEAYAVYQKGDMKALQPYSEALYSKLKASNSIENIERCAIVDMFSNSLDSYMSSFDGKPNKYFSESAIKKRLKAHLEALGMTKAEIDKLVRIWKGQVQKEMTVVLKDAS